MYPNKLERNWDVVPMESSPGGFRPVDEQKRCRNEDCKWGAVVLHQFGPNETCPECDGTALREPFKSQQLALNELKALMAKADWSSVDVEAIKELKTKVEQLLN